MKTKTLVRLFFMGCGLFIIAVLALVLIRQESPESRAREKERQDRLNSALNLRSGSPNQQGYAAGKDGDLHLGEIYSAPASVLDNTWRMRQFGTAVCYQFHNGNTVDVSVRLSPDKVLVKRKDGNFEFVNGTGFKTGGIGVVQDEDVEIKVGSGDLMPIMRGAKYRRDGATVLIDWSDERKHTEFWSIPRGFDSSSGVMTIENEGYVLRDAASGRVLTLQTKI